MKNVKSIKALLVVLVLLGIATISVNGKETRSLNFKQATYYNVPAWGGCEYYLDSGHKDIKASTSKTASIKGTTKSWLGATSAIVNNVGVLRSENVNLVNNWNVAHPNTSASQGWSYYNRACTSGIEPNETNIDVRYSSDHID